MNWAFWFILLVGAGVAFFSPEIAEWRFGRYDEGIRSLATYTLLTFGALLSFISLAVLYLADKIDQLKK